MKSIKILLLTTFVVAAAFASGPGAAPASANYISPRCAGFSCLITANGAAALEFAGGVKISCTVQASGQAFYDGTFKFNAVSFTAPSSPLCSLLSPSPTPWYGYWPSSTTIQLQWHFTFGSYACGTGGSYVPGAWAETTPAAAFAVQPVAPSCKINGAFLTFAFY